MRVRLQNDSGYIVEAKLGFSWSLLFFPLFVPLVRKDLKWAGIMWSTWLAAVLLPIPLLWLWNTFTLVMAYLYNNIYVKDLLAKGYKPMSSIDADRQVLLQSGFDLPLESSEPLVILEGDVVEEVVCDELLDIQKPD